MKITITDPWLGEREFDVESEDFKVLFIADQLNLLLEFLRDKRDDDTHLRYDIGVYEYILTGTNPGELAQQYYDARNELGTFCKKQEIAEKLGWKITPYQGGIKQ